LALLADKTTIFDGVIASTISQVTLTGGARPELLRGNYITTNTFVVLGGLWQNCALIRLS